MNNLAPNAMEESYDNLDNAVLVKLSIGPRMNVCECPCLFSCDVEELLRVSLDYGEINPF